MKVITCGAAFDPSQEWWKSVASTTNHQQLMSVLKEGENYHVAIIDSVVGGVCLTKELSCFKREVPQTTLSIIETW